MPEPGESTRYDQVAYPARAFAQTHPNRLATLARLSGLDPAPPENCRVLELGCGEAANLVPMAVALENSRFVSVDVAALSIAAGNETIRALGLSNIELASVAIEDIDPGLGAFDYVIAHGVYSWVPEAVRDALLAACKRHLAPHGVAFVSYSAYPGGYFRELVREMMLFHAGEIDDPALRVGRGIEFVRWVRSLHGERTAYAAVLDFELERLKSDPNYVFHDDFSETNTPVYFSQFAEHAVQNGLRFFAEASPLFFGDPVLKGQSGRKLKELSGGDLLAREQYLDFMRGCPFRQSLLCHAALAPKSEANVGRLLELYAASPLLATVESPDLRSESALTFAAAGGEVEVQKPLIKGAFHVLGSLWPAVIRISELLARARELSGQPASSSATDEELVQFAGALLHAASSSVLDLWTSPPRFTLRPSERPLASPLCRLQIQQGEIVTSLRHLMMRIEDRASRHLLTLLDGIRSRAELLAEMRSHWSAHPPHDAPVTEPDAAALETVLDRMAKSGLLLA